MSNIPITNIRAINFYKFVDGEKVYRNEIQFRRLGSLEWIPIEYIEREDIDIDPPEVSYHLREYLNDGKS